MRITVLGRRTIINYTGSVSPWTQLTKEHDNEAWQLCLKVHDSPLCFVLDSYTMHKLRNLNVAIGQLLLGNQVFCFGPAKANKLKKQTKKYNKGLSGLITIHIEVDLEFGLKPNQGWSMALGCCSRKQIEFVLFLYRGRQNGRASSK